MRTNTDLTTTVPFSRTDLKPGWVKIDAPAFMHDGIVHSVWTERLGLARPGPVSFSIIMDELEEKRRYSQTQEGKIILGVLYRIHPVSIMGSQVGYLARYTLIPLMR